MHYPALPSSTVTPPIIAKGQNQRIAAIYTTANRRNWRNVRVTPLTTCKASKSSYSSITDFNLYDLLGIDSSSDQSQIKSAYRALQKRCHPDIAGPAGHDMAIILNEAYALLSDPNSRLAYDKEQSKFSDFQGYTGKPIYSAWLGSENEERAVFVDELKCVGCLKCALLAEKTFAIESVFGRARVIGQWADPEHKILEAIDACPVDCITIIKRSDLAALEFLMSKQPRANVRIGTGNTVGVRSSDVFLELEKFQVRYQDSKKKASADHDQTSDVQRAATISAINAIRTISNWLYWQLPKSGNAAEVDQNLMLICESSSDPNIQKLRDAVAANNKAKQRRPPIEGCSDEYWAPSTIVIPEAANDLSGHKARAAKPEAATELLVNEKLLSELKSRRNPFSWVVPVGAAVVAAIVVRLNVGEETSGDLKQHVAGSLALQIVNSYWLQVILAGVTWYLIGMAAMELIETVRSKKLGQ